MRLQFLIVSANVVLAGCIKHDISVAQAKNCSVINIGPVTVAKRKASLTDKLEFRRLRSLEASFMVGVFSDQRSVGGPPIYGEQKFFFDLSIPHRVRPATEADWERGEEVLLDHGFLESICDSSAVKNDPAIVYDGKKFFRAGKEWAFSHCAFASPDGQWITLQSWDPKPPQRFEFRIDPPHKDFPSDSDFYVEVFDARSAKKVAAVQLSFAGIVANPYRDDTGWLTERYLVLPVTHRYLETFMICDTRS